MDAEWDTLTRAGELFRAEAKSMNMGADESKAHFDELAQNIRPEDLLVVIAWRWELDGKRNWPAVCEIFIDRALPSHSSAMRSTSRVAGRSSIVPHVPISAKPRVALTTENH